MAFYEKFTALKKELENVGHSVIAPELEFETKGDDTSVGAFLIEMVGLMPFHQTMKFGKRKEKLSTLTLEKLIIVNVF